MKSSIKITLVFSAAILLFTLPANSQNNNSHASFAPWKGKLLKELVELHHYQTSQKTMKTVVDTAQPDLWLGAEQIPGFVTLINQEDDKVTYTARRQSDSLSAEKAMRSMLSELRTQTKYKIFDSNLPNHQRFFTDEYGLKAGEKRILRVVGKDGDNIAFITEGDDGVITVTFE